MEGDGFVVVVVERLGLVDRLGVGELLGVGAGGGADGVGVEVDGGFGGVAEVEGGGGFGGVAEVEGGGGLGGFAAVEGGGELGLGGLGGRVFGAGEQGATDLREDAGAQFGVGELGELGVHQRVGAVDVAGLDAQADQALDRGGQALALLRVALAGGDAGGEDAGVELGGELGVAEFGAGEAGGLEQAVGLAEEGEAVDEGGVVELGAGEGDLAGDEGGSSGGGEGEFGRDGGEGLVDDGEGGAGLVGLLLERVGEGAGDLDDAGGDEVAGVRGLAGGVGEVAEGVDGEGVEVGVGALLGEHVLVGGVGGTCLSGQVEGGADGGVEALAEQLEALVEATAAADEAAEAEQDVVVLGGLGGEGLEGAHGRGLVAEAFLQGAGLDDEQGDAGVAVVLGDLGEALVDDREEQAELAGLEVEALELGERLGVVLAALCDVLPGGDRLGDLGEVLLRDGGDAGLGAQLELRVGHAGGGGPERVDGAVPQALADQQVGEALLDLRVLRELLGEGLEAAGGVDLAVDAGDEVVHEREGAGDAGVGVELGGLEVEEAGAGVDEFAVTAAALVDARECAQGVALARGDGDDGLVLLLGAVELACLFVQVGEAQAVADDVFGDGELADEAAVGVDEAVLALFAGGEGLQAGAQVEVVGGEGEGFLEVGERGLGLVGALVPQAGEGGGHGGALGLAGGGGSGVGEGELFPAGVGGGSGGEGGGGEFGEGGEAGGDRCDAGALGLGGGGGGGGGLGRRGGLGGCRGLGGLLDDLGGDLGGRLAWLFGPGAWARSFGTCPCGQLGSAGGELRGGRAGAALAGRRGLVAAGLRAGEGGLGAGAEQLVVVVVFVVDELADVDDVGLFAAGLDLLDVVHVDDAGVLAGLAEGGQLISVEVDLAGEAGVLEVVELLDHVGGVDDAGVLAGLAEGGEFVGLEVDLAGEADLLDLLDVGGVDHAGVLAPADLAALEDELAAEAGGVDLLDVGEVDQTAELAGEGAWEFGGVAGVAAGARREGGEGDGVEAELVPEVLVGELGGLELRPQQRVAHGRGGVVVADQLGELPQARVDRAELEVAVAGVRAAGGQVGRAGGAEAPGGDAGAQGVLGAAEVLLVQVGDLAEQAQLVLLAWLLGQLPGGHEQDQVPQVLALGEAVELEAGLVAAGVELQHAEPLGHGALGVGELLLAQLGALLEEVDLGVGVDGGADVLLQGGEGGEGADAGVALGAGGVEVGGELADLREQALGGVVGDALLEGAQGGEQVAALLVLDAGGLAEGGEGAAGVALAGAHAGDDAMVLGELGPQAVAFGELDQEVHGLLGERGVLGAQVVPGAAQPGEGLLGGVQLALVDLGDRVAGLEAGEAGAGAGEAGLVELDEGGPEVVDLGGGLDLAGELLVLGAQAVGALQEAEAAVGVEQALAGDLRGGEEQGDGAVVAVGGRLAGLLQGELLLGDLEHLGPQAVLLGHALEAVEHGGGVEAGAQGHEVGFFCPREGDLDVADALLGGHAGAHGDLDLAAGVAAGAHLGEALGVDDEQVLPHAVGLGEGLDLGLELAAGRGDAQCATEELQGPLGVAEAVLADLGHLLEGDDLLGGVVADLEAALEGGEGAGVVAGEGLQLAHDAQAVGVVGRLGHEALEAGEGLLLHLEVDQPAAGDHLVELAALVDVVAREEEELGVADELVVLGGALVELEQAGGDVAVADGDAGGEGLEHAHGGGGVVELVGEDLGALPADGDRLLVGVDHVLQVAERGGEAVPGAEGAVDAGEGLDGAAVVAVDPEHALEGGAGEVVVAQRRLGEVAEAHEVVELADRRGLGGGGGLAEEVGQFFVAPDRLVDADHLVEDLHVVGVGGEQLVAGLGGALRVLQLALGDVDHAPQGADAGRGLADDLQLAGEGVELAGGLGQLGAQRLHAVEGLGVALRVAEHLLAGPQRLAGQPELVLPDLGHAPEQHDALRDGAGDVVLAAQEVDDLIVGAGALVHLAERLEGVGVAGGEGQHLVIEGDRALRVGHALALGLGQAAHDLEAAGGLVGAGQLVFLRDDHVVEHAGALVEAADLLARAPVAGVGGGEAVPGDEGPAEVAEAALVDLGELGEVLGEFGAGERALGAGDLLGLIDLVEQELGEVRPVVLAAPVLLVALEGLGVEGLALEDLEVEDGGALLVAELLAGDLRGHEQAVGRGGVRVLLEPALDQADEAVVVAEVAQQGLEPAPGVAAGGLELAGGGEAGARLLAAGEVRLEQLAALQPQTIAVAVADVAEPGGVELVELHPPLLGGEHLGQRVAGLEVVGLEREGAAQEAERLAVVVLRAGQLGGPEEHVGGLGEAVVGGLAGGQVEHAEGAQGGDVVGAGLERGLQVERGGGDALDVLGLDAGEAEVELGEADLVLLRVEARELGVHQVGGLPPGAGAEVEADELFAGVAVGGALLEGLAKQGGGLVDVAELRLVEEAELDQGGGHGVAVVAAQVLDAPAQQGGELGVGAELLIELAQEVEGADVLGLGLQRADQSVGRLAAILHAVVPQLVGLEGQLADLGGVLDRGGVQHQEGGERRPIFGFAQGPARAQEGVVAARRLAIRGELLRLAAGRRRQRSGQVFQRGCVRSRGGDVHVCRVQKGASAHRNTPRARAGRAVSGAQGPGSEGLSSGMGGVEPCHGRAGRPGRTWRREHARDGASLERAHGRSHARIAGGCAIGGRLASHPRSCCHRRCCSRRRARRSPPRQRRSHPRAADRRRARGRRRGGGAAVGRRRDLGRAPRRARLRPPARAHALQALA